VEGLEVKAKRENAEAPEYPEWQWYAPDEHERIGVIGIPRHGKSRFVKAWVRHLLARNLPVVAWDVHDEHSQAGRLRSRCELGGLRLRMTASEFLERVASEHFFLDARLALSIVPDDPDDYEAVGAQFAEVAPWFKRRGSLYVVVEELGEWAEYAEKTLRAMATGWGKEGVVPFFISQEWVDFFPRLRNAITKVVSFKQTGRQAISFLRREIGPAFSEAVPFLERDAFRVADKLNPAAENIRDLLGADAAQPKE
jgi:hypothetical protein